MTKPEFDLEPRTRPARIKQLRERLLAWYDVSRRDLPWRRSRDPYAIWISEAMLQQTRIETVIPYYMRFLKRFPDVEALAAADRDDVFELWTGLGYYSRARNLHRSAQMVMDEFGGKVPSTAPALRKLPGVGRYTAGAVASIAFGREEAVVDGNVVRVLSRLLDIRADVTRKDVVERIWEEAGALARGPRPGDLNQALMELGATVCTPRSPRCENLCPMKRLCRGRQAGDVTSLPNKPKKKKPRPVSAIAAWIQRRGEILIVKRPDTGLLANLWELPGGELPAAAEPKDQVVRILRERTGVEVQNPIAAGTVDHIFTHLRLSLHVFRCQQVGGRVRLKAKLDSGLNPYQAHRWVKPARLLELPQATLNRKALELLF